MDKDRIAVIDVETTGLSPWRHDRVVEIAIVVIEPDGSVHTEYETLVNPDRDLGPCRIHKISASDVLRAPAFADVAGDILQILAGANAIAGHNVSFDHQFLVKEYERIGVVVPKIPLLCTCRLFGRNNLQACCKELGITFEGAPHRAISDARVTARIVSFLHSEDSALLESHRLLDVQWPELPALNTPCFRREHAQADQDLPPRFLSRLSQLIHHDVEAETPNVLAYMALVDRVLEDRTIDEDEENTLVDAALNWQLPTSQLRKAHFQYLQNLVVAALADGVVSDSERRDLHLVAKLLGQDDTTLDQVLELAASQLAGFAGNDVGGKGECELTGKRVCFTGELQSTLEGKPISRDVAEALATKAGLVVASAVTKKLDILVVADPHTQSGKAKKAKSYGIRILADSVFWKMIGVPID